MTAATGGLPTGAMAAPQLPAIDNTSFNANNGGGHKGGHKSGHKSNKPGKSAADQAVKGQKSIATAAPAVGPKASRQEVLSFLDWAAAQYGANPQVLRGIAERESGFSTGQALNDWDSNARAGTPSMGMFQFVEGTFSGNDGAKGYAQLAKEANPKAWAAAGIGKPQWLDWRAQALATSWAITHGKGSAWTTYDDAKAAAN